jgi:hypothetical protein
VCVFLPVALAVTLLELACRHPDGVFEGAGTGPRPSD